MPTHDYSYPVALKKRAGSGPIDSNQRNIFCSGAEPENPDNNQYIPGINSSTFPSVVSLGKKSPRVGLHSCLKPRTGSLGWSNADIFNSLVHVDASNNTDYFAICFANEQDTVIYDYHRCERLDFSGNAQGGIQAVMMGFIGRWGEADGPYNTTLPSGEIIGPAPTFTMTGQTPDYGIATPSSMVNFVGLSEVMTYQMSFLRGQAARFYFGSGPGPAVIASTMFSGLLTIEQESDATTTIADTGSVTVQFDTGQTSSTGRFRVNLLLKRDNMFRPRQPRIGTRVSTYSMFAQSSGGNPAIFESY